jgi:hypothetical protein
MSRFLLVVLVLFVASSNTAQAACSVGRFGLFAGATTETTMVVSSGANCGINVRPGREGRFDSTRIVTPAKNGTVSRHAVGGFTYRSKPGFKGQDSFAFAVTGKIRSVEGTATVRVSVTVN